MSEPVAGANKVAQVTLLFWVIKICATTLGETAGDLLSMTLDIGYAASSVLLLGLFAVVLILQIRSARYQPVLYWFVIVATSTAGTTMSDFLNRSVGLGYASGSVLLGSILIAVLLLWRRMEGSLSVAHIARPRAEMLYWAAILVSNTLGTSMGDYLADDSGLGYLGGAALIASLLAISALAYWRSSISRVALFWVAFVLTRPFGATFGDLLTKAPDQDGLGLGTIGASAVLMLMLVVLVVRETTLERRRSVA